MQCKNVNLKVSIIVPIYNGEKVIKECIQSVLNQSYKNLELLLINDGSSDNTEKICKEFESKYDRIKLYNNKNQGVSYTRNFGIEKATGEYIFFLDCDDFIEKETVELLLNINNNYDFIIANYSKYYSKSKIEKNAKMQTREYTKQEFLENFWYLYNSYIINSPCNRLYKRNILNQYNIRFKLEYSLGEDLLFNLEYIEKCNKIYTLNKYLYNYRYTENSLTTKFRNDYIENQLKLNDEVKNFLIRNNNYNNLDQKNIDKDVANIIISGIQNLFLESCTLNKKQVRKILKEYLSLPEIEKLNQVNYEEKKLQIFKNMIEKKRTNQIILYSRVKEVIKKIIR